MLNRLALLVFIMGFPAISHSQQTTYLSVNGFPHWVTGRDSATVQYIPSTGYDPLVKTDEGAMVHVKFKVAGYGEVSFPIKPVATGNEAPAVNLGKSRYIRIRYKSNVKVVLQLRQTGVHGGTHNHVVLPRSATYVTKTIYFNSFGGGLSPLDLSNVAKFNFALLENDVADDYAELEINSVEIDRYKPSKRE